MPSTNLFGPYPLTDGSINDRVEGRGPGVCALGDSGRTREFECVFVGRSDEDLSAYLHTLAGKYPEFRYAFQATPRHAYLKECLLYHELNPAGNPRHPSKPASVECSCPVCGEGSGRT